MDDAGQEQQSEHVYLPYLPRKSIYAARRGEKIKNRPPKITPFSSITFSFSAHGQDHRGRDTPHLTTCAYDMPCMEIGNEYPGRYYEPWPLIR